MAIKTDTREPLLPTDVPTDVLFRRPKTVFEVDPREVTGVLLVDGWHSVQAGSFTLSHGIEYDDIADTDTSFCFREAGQTVAGPMSSVLAVRV